MKDLRLSESLNVFLVTELRLTCSVQHVVHAYIQVEYLTKADLDLLIFVDCLYEYSNQDNESS